MRGDCVSDARDDAYSAFKELTKFLDGRAIGFDEMFRSLGSRVTENRTSYPPYNIVKVDDSTYRLEVAAAGFGKSELDVTVQDNSLVIKGVSNSGEKNYVHRGIASRDFTLKFALAEDVVVTTADMVNGLLVVNLEVIIPEHKKPRKIELGAPASDPKYLAG
jgi:molecular chaperone IbpA